MQRNPQRIQRTTGPSTLPPSEPPERSADASARPRRRLLRRLSTLQLALIISIAVHAGLLAVRIVDPESFNRVFQDTPLEVVLVNARSAEAPEKIQAIAQANLSGGGEAAAGRATSPLPPSPAVQTGEANQDSTQRIEQLQETQEQLLAQIRRELALLPAPDPQHDQGTPEERAQDERRRQLVQLLAEIEKRINEENARPKKRYISPATREEVYAIYYDALRRKIELRGTRNFPENQGRKLYGRVDDERDGRRRGPGRRNRGRARLELQIAGPPCGRDRQGGRAVRPLQRGDATHRGPARHHVALQIHPRRGSRDQLERHTQPLRTGLSMDRYVVVGNPIEHSQSPYIHAEFARETGQALEYGRMLWPIGSFAESAKALAASGARGCNVTVPFKFEAFHNATRLTPRARLAEAANVLTFDAEGGFLADNSDGIGLVNDIERNAGLTLAGARLLLIGAGGAAAGVLGPLLAAGPREIVVANRTLEKAQRLVERHRAVAGGAGLRASRLEDCGEGFDVVVNASASSLAGAGVPVADAVLMPGTLALDMMYGPAAQAFLGWAEARGARARDGLGMLVEQAAEAFAHWRGVRPSTAPVLAALQDPHGRGAPMMRGACGQLLRVALLLLVSAASLQFYFLGRVALMAAVDPQSTTFQRSEAWRLLVEKHAIAWSRQWVGYERISPNLKRAVIASEDSGFTEHSGVEWDAPGKGLGPEPEIRSPHREDQRTAGTPRAAPGQGAEPAAGQGRAEGRRRLDDHAATGEESVPRQRTASRAQGSGIRDHLHARSAAVEAAHPRDLPEQRRVGRGRVRRRGGLAALFSRRREQPWRRLRQRSWR